MCAEIAKKVIEYADLSDRRALFYYIVRDLGADVRYIKLILPIEFRAIRAGGWITFVGQKISKPSRKRKVSVLELRVLERLRATTGCLENINILSAVVAFLCAESKRNFVLFVAGTFRLDYSYIRLIFPSKVVEPESSFEKKIATTIIDPSTKATVIEGSTDGSS